MSKTVQKLQFLLVFLVVLLAHTMLLSTEVLQDVKFIDTEAKVQHITLTKIAVKKPIFPSPSLVLEENIEKAIQVDVEVKVIPKKEMLNPKKKKLFKKKKKYVNKKKKVLKKKHQKYQKTIKKQKIYASQESRVTLKDKYIGQIRAQIQKKLVYPNIAKRMHMEDVIYVTFTVYQNGDVGDIHVLKGQKTILKKSAIKILKKLVIKAIPKALGITKLELRLPISFKIVRG